MAQISRRVLLLLTGVLIAGAIGQRIEAASGKKSSSAPSPAPSKPSQDNTSPDNASPTPTPEETSPTPSEEKVSPSATEVESKKDNEPTPQPSPEETPAPQDSESYAEDGVVIAKSSELILRQTKVFYIKDSFGISTGYSLTRTSRGIVAFDIRCTHAGVPSALIGTKLECPAHGSIFDPESGQVLAGPALEPLRSYPTLEANGEIRIFIS